MIDDDPVDPRVYDALGRAVPHHMPPPALRARVLSTAAPAGVSKPSSARARWPSLLAAAATLVALVASYGWWAAQAEVTRLQGALAELQTETGTLRAVRDGFEREQRDARRMAAIIGASDVTRVSLTGLAPATAARAQVYVSRSNGMLFLAEGLPDLPPDRVYQLWSIVAGAPVSGGVFSRASDGRAQLLAPPPPGAPQALAVTVEPTGGVPAPTGPQYLLGAPTN
jgi:hypothetical protein